MKIATSLFIVFFSAVLLLFIGGTNYWLYSSNVERINNTFDSKPAAMLTQIASLSGYYITHYEHELLNKLFLHTSDSDEVLFLSIKDVNGDVFLSDGHRNDSKSRYYRKSIIHGNKNIGVVELSIEDNSLKEALRKALNTSVMLTFITVSLVVLMLILFVRTKTIEKREMIAKAESQAQSTFLSHMSHELRTPLNAILGFGDILLHKNDDPLTDKQKEIMGYMLKGGDHLLTLVNELLDQAKIKAGKVNIHIEKTCIKDILDDILVITNTLAERHNIQIEICTSIGSAPDIHTDCTRLKQILLNLVSNAIKYNRENGKVTVECHELPGKMLRASVIDTGKGISEEEIEDLFKPFHRMNYEDNDIEGTGIGLTITKQLVEIMGGIIGVDSEVGKGSTFWVELPVAE